MEKLKRRKSLLTPDLSVQELDEIDLNSLWAQGFRGIILDLDNTITPWHRNELRKNTERFVKQARVLGFKICLLSNASKQRTELIAAGLNVPFVAPALKPRKQGYRRALSLLGLEAEQVVSVGDQIFTDILGGKRMGCYTILIPPLSRVEFPGTKILRLLEKLIAMKN